MKSPFKIFGPLFAALLVGCGSFSSQEQHQADSVREKLLKSPTVRAFTSSIRNPWTYMSDYSLPDGEVYQVGEDTPEHFVPGLTVKVTRSGDVFVRVTDEIGEERWEKR